MPPYAWAALALLAAFALGTRGFLSGETYPTWDADGLFGPYYMLIADLVRHGKLLWWNPWANGGEPDFIDMQYGAHSPVVLLLALLFGPTVRGFIAYWFTLWLVFGFGLLALARSWSVPAWAGLMVALGMMFSGFFTGHAEHTPCLFSWVWMPWVLFRLDVSLRDRRWAPAVQAGVLFGLSAVGGYPAIVFTNGVFLIFWILVRVTFNRDQLASTDAPEPRSPLAVAVRLSALFGAVVAVLALPTFYFFFHEGKGSPRGWAPYRAS